MTLKKTIFITISFFLLEGYSFSKQSFAQNQSAIEFALVPSIGFSFSFFELAKGYSMNDLHHTQRLIGRKDFYWGIGLQARLLNDWTVTASISEAWLGGGYTSKYNSSWTSEITYNFSLNFEKRVYETTSLNLWNQKFSYRLNLLLGSGIYWIPPSDRVVEISSGTQFGVYKKFTSTTKNNVSGIVNIGFTNQLFHNKKPKLKFGVLYTYGWMPSREFTYELTYLRADNAQENFKVNTGKHRLLLYLEYPIILYRNKAQKEYYKSK